ncbi:hypothetical protein DM45_2094 [Burkholderia mallei]|nr:hypothetical protein DM75_4242 [Burkholderia mallei]KOS90051.1 hypothetical protein DM53_4041 [Burkholderia mallei]KOS90700.1 hypothetical protein DM45_2094 [Burkholderia mallei]KOT20759.1 hypothetical protein DM52_1310 [Burkholderia mallei]
MPRHTSADTAGYRREDTLARVACIGIAGAAATCGGGARSRRSRSNVRAAAIAAARWHYRAIRVKRSARRMPSTPIRLRFRATRSGRCSASTASRHARGDPVDQRADHPLAFQIVHRLVIVAFV